MLSRELLLLSLAPAVAWAGTCSLATNYDNMQYVTDITIGTPPQAFGVVADSGSPELLVLSNQAQCEDNGQSTNQSCLGEHHTFNANASTSVDLSNMAVKMVYGSGPVTGQLATDKVALANTNDYASKQTLILMLGVGFPNFVEDAFDGIMGLGVPSTSETNTPSLLSNFGAESFGICFGPMDGDKARLDIGRKIETANEWSRIPLAGTSTWSVGFGGICTSNGCTSGPQGGTALIDSGTSLISLPGAFYHQTLSLIGKVKEDCSNLDSLPTLKITLGGTVLELPPQTYVVKVTMEKVKTIHKGPFAYHVRTGEFDSVCQPGIMKGDVMGYDGPLIILGMPVFRAYSVYFDRKDASISFSKHTMESNGICTFCKGNKAEAIMASKAVVNATAAPPKRVPAAPKHGKAGKGAGHILQPEPTEELVAPPVTVSISRALMPMRSGMIRRMHPEPPIRSKASKVAEAQELERESMPMFELPPAAVVKASEKWRKATGENFEWWVKL